MKVVGLLSGGKDSCYNLMHCVANGHEVIGLATLTPEPGVDELDSYLYQSVGTSLFLPLISQALRLPLYRRVISGKPLNVDLTYGSRSTGVSLESGDETEDLYELLLRVKESHPDVQGISTGAILSSYQRTRIEHVANRLGMTCISYLWQRPEGLVVDEMIDAGLVAVLVKVAGLGLKETDVGKTLNEMRVRLGYLESMYGCHVAGEGGEFETITLDCPLFHDRIAITESETIVTDPSPVAYLSVKSAKLVPKPNHVVPDQTQLRSMLKIDDEDAEGMYLIDEQSRLILDGLETEGTGKTSSTDSVDKMSEGFTKTNLSAGRNRDKSGRTEAEGLIQFKKLGNWFAASIESIPEEDESIGEEVTRCFETLKTTLADHQLSLLHIQHQNFLLSDMAFFPLANKSYSSFFGSSPPSRACVAIPLPSSQRIRLDIHGYDDQTLGSNQPMSRTALHVQGMSYWAPANIGPYSQAVMVGHRLTIAGQIGLIPPTLLLPEPKSFRQEAVLALQHVRRILEVLRSKSTAGGGWKGWVEGVICWFVERKDLDIARSIWKEFDKYGETGNPPVLFLQTTALPKNALVEWQFVLHTGRKVRLLEQDGDDDDGDEVGDWDEPARTPEVLRDSFEGANIQACSSKEGDSSFRIMTTSSHSIFSQALKNPLCGLADSFSMRVFYSSTLPEDEVRALSKPFDSVVVAHIPVTSISTMEEEELDIGCVMMGTCP